MIFFRKFGNFIFNRAKRILYNRILIPCLFKKIYRKNYVYNIKSVRETAFELSVSNKSLGRFGDGELMWLIGKNSGVRFENPSRKLSIELSRVLNSDDDNFMVGLPDPIRSLQPLTSKAKYFWKRFFIRNRNYQKYLNKKKTYYNAFVSRPYMDFNLRKIADDTFKYLKLIWQDKNILIIEGAESHLGLNNDLFNNAKNIKRIECPIMHAFESYSDILSSSKKFLNNHKDYIALIALGPTATILAYDLFKSGYRAIDVGHVDVEYEWYRIGAKEKINLPDRYVAEAKNKYELVSIIDEKYKNQIICIIK